MANALRFKQPNLPRQANEVARFKVVQGPDIGVTFVLTGNTASIGRGDENDLVLTDLKASRVHARIQETEKGFLIQDQGSANGIVFKDQVVREALLNSSDQITLGETTLEFLKADVSSRKLSAAPDFLKIFARRNQPQTGSKKNPANPLILLLGGAVLFLFLFPGTRSLQIDPTQGGAQTSSVSGNGVNAGAKTPAGEQVDLSAYLPEVQIDKSSEVFYKEGIREYYLGNYNRARTQFETVLQITPGYRLATVFLEKCSQAIEAQVKSNLLNGKRAHSLGKLREARGYFERVMRLLYREPTNPSFIQARDEDEKIGKELSATDATADTESPAEAPAGAAQEEAQP